MSKRYHFGGPPNRVMDSRATNAAGLIGAESIYGWQVRANVEVWLQSTLPLLVSRQATKLVELGRYWQGLATHSANPDHTYFKGIPTNPDELDRTPHDQPGNTWEDALPEYTGPQLASLRIDVYDGPGGKGWVAVVEVEQNGVRYRRAVNHGPETYRDRPWTLVKEASV